MGLIYKIACDLTNKCYIGQTRRSLKKRIGQHKYESRNGSKHAIHNAIRKYGWDSFKVEILEDNIPLKNLNKKEIYWGEKYNTLAPNGYNLELGNGNNKIISEEIRKKKSGKNNHFFGKHHSEESKKKISDSKKGICGGINHPLYGKYHSKESKEKMSISHQKMKYLYAKKILCYDIKNNFIKEFNSMKDASKELNLHLGHITEVCQGKRKRVKNYKFKYK